MSIKGHCRNTAKQEGGTKADHDILNSYSGGSTNYSENHFHLDQSDLTIIIVPLLHVLPTNVMSVKPFQTVTVI